MNFFAILAAVGLLALAGLAGIALAKLEEKIILGREKQKPETVTKKSVV